MSTDDSTYQEFREKVEHIYNIDEASEMLSWDQQVMMPKGGTPARSEQLSTLSSVRHDLLTRDETGDLLTELESEEISEKRRAVVREVKREYERKSRVPTDLIEKISKTSTEALPKWEKAKAKDDFSGFSGILEKQIRLKKEYAEEIDPDSPPYEVLFKDYEPYLGLDTTEEILNRLREELVPIIEEIRESEVDIATDVFSGKIDTNTQEKMVRKALDDLTFDWDRGRLDTSSHPFSLGNQYDARVTTRFNEENPIDALTSTVHEFGHATYNLGLPESEYGTPLGSAREMGIHESQSRLWENHVGRSKSFWRFFLPRVEELVPSLDTSLNEVYESVNQVYEDNLIRVEADELTYHMHIILRFEIEREIIEGDLEVDDIPQVWNDKMEEYLGVRPETDSEGCLQDIHWSHGYFGYFPTYSVGSVLAAQVYNTAKEEIDGLEERITEGEFEDLHNWLTQNIHRHGQRYTTDELIVEATGEELNPDYFIEHIENRYSEIYPI